MKTRSCLEKQQDVNNLAVCKCDGKNFCLCEPTVVSLDNLTEAEGGKKQFNAEWKMKLKVTGVWYLGADRYKGDERKELEKKYENNLKGGWLSRFFSGCCRRPRKFLSSCSKSGRNFHRLIYEHVAHDKATRAMMGSMSIGRDGKITHIPLREGEM